MNEARAIVPAQAGGREPSPALPGHKGSEQMTTDVAAAGFDPARFTTERYDQLSTRILNEAGAVVAMIEQLTDGRWAIFLADRRVSRSFASRTEAFKWWQSEPRDSDGNPQGGDSEAAPSRSDDSAGPQDIAPSLSSEPSS